MPSKLGPHAVIGPRNGYGDFLTKIANAGKTLAIVKCVDDFGPAKEAKDRMPGCLTVGRINSTDDPAGNFIDLQGVDPLNSDGSYKDPKDVALWYFSLVRSGWESRPWIDVWETLNEMSSHWAWQGDFFIAMMALAEGIGKKVAGYACSTGNPPGLPTDLSVANQFVPFCRAAKQRGHYLSLHEYTSDHALRYRMLYNQVLIPQGADCNLLISEAAPETHSFLGVDAFMSWVTQYDAGLRQDRYVIGATLFTLGTYAESNWQAALPALGDYSVSVTDAPPPPPPPPPTECRGKPRLDYPAVRWAYPSTATEDQAVDVFRQAFRAGRQTVTGSYDDAMQGDLSDRWARLVGIPPEQQIEFTAFRDQYYPGVTLDFPPMPGSVPQPFKLLSPVEGIPLFITSPFNAPRDYDGDGIADDRHEGVDLRSVDANGNPVYTLAAADGVVEKVFNNGRFGGWGRYVIVRHDRPDGNVYKSAHAHLERIDVAEGHRVVAGQRLGLTGNTGNTGDPPAIHLHYTLYWIGHPDPGWEHNDVVDPARYLPPPGTIQPPPSPPPPPPPPPTQTAVFGLHMRAGGLDHNHLSFAAELDILRTARLDVVKFTNNSTFESLDGLIATGCNPGQMVMRLHMAGSDPNLTNATRFFELHRAWIDRYLAHGGLAIEVHNEPNRTAEWPLDAPAFASWFDSVRGLIEASFPTARVGFPGLSPNPNVPAWISACAAAIGRADWMGAHCYWLSLDQLTHPEHGGYWQRYVSLGKPILITEFSNPSPSVPKADKARQYLEYVRGLPYPPVAAAYAFVSSATSGFVYETWYGSEIPKIIGER